MHPITVPASFTKETIAREGAPGRAWIERLPRLVATYLDRWQIAVDGALTCGSVALVVPVRRQDGAPAILKLSWLDDETRCEPVALAAWSGRGAVLVLARDDASGALLLERLDATRTLLNVSDDGEATSLAGGVLRRLAIPAPDGIPPLSTVADRWRADWLRRWGQLGQPFPRRVLGAAIATCRDLGGSGGQYLVHGDLHFGNVLAGEREAWLAIDPKPLSGDREFDAVPLLRNRWPELVAQGDVGRALDRRLTVLIDSAGFDRLKAMRWVQARAVEDALWARSAGDGEFAAIAEEIAARFA